MSGHSDESRAVRPEVGGVVGYIILTSHADGSWHDDWDGEVHVALREADAAYQDAVSRMEDPSGHEDYFMLAQLVRVRANVPDRQGVV